MTIGIYESEHFETVYPVLRVLDNGINRITVYTTAAVARQLNDQLGADSNKFQWVLKEDGQSIRHFISTITDHAQQQAFDFFLFNTVSSNHWLFANMTSKIPATAFYLVVHDVNNLIKSQPGLGLRKLIRHFGKKRLLKNCKGFFSISSRTTAYLSNFINDGRSVRWFPGAIFEEANYVGMKLSAGTHIRIVVPGTLDSRRRNYQQVFNLVEYLIGKNLPIEIGLLGGASGVDSLQLLEQCKRLSNKYDGFSFYEVPEVPYAEFNKQLQSAHFIWVPSTVNTIMADGIAETYGQSKSSGNMFDAIRYAKPLLIPAALTIDKEQEEGAYIYGNQEELISFLSNLIQHPELYENWAEKALEVSRKYSVSKLQGNLVAYFSK